jgi:ribonuclease E
MAEAPRAPAPVQQPEPPRKRSTVREPAPTAITVDAAQPTPAQPASPPPQPVITEVGDSENTDKPRRSGWWSRRFAGG